MICWDQLNVMPMLDVAQYTRFKWPEHGHIFVAVHLFAQGAALHVYEG